MKLKPRWTDNEIQAIRENYGIISARLISEQINRTTPAIWQKAKSIGLGHPKGEGKLFDKNAKEDLAYILGVLKGDGTVFNSKLYGCQKSNYQVRLVVTDKEFADSFYDALTKIGLSPHIKQIKPRPLSRKPIWGVVACSKPLVNWCHSLSLDDIYDYLKTDEQKIQFIRGFYESEGCLQSKSRQLGMYNNNPQLVQLVERILKDLGFDFHQAKYGKQYMLRLFKKAEVERFLGLIRSVIPRRSLAAMGGWCR